MNDLIRAALVGLLCICALMSNPAAAIVAVYVEDGAADPGARATVPLDLTTHDDIYGFTLTVHYDPAVVSVADVTGSELMEEWGEAGMSWTDDPVTGELLILGSSRGLPAISFTSGDLLEIGFDVADTADIGSISSVSLDPAEFFDEGGVALLTFTESGEITVSDPDAEPTPPAPSFAIGVLDIEADPGGVVNLEIWLTNEAPMLALVFDLLVDSAALSVDESRSVEIPPRAEGLTYAMMALTEDAHRYGLASSDPAVSIPEGEGWILRLPYQVSEAATPGRYSLLLGLAAGFDDTFTEVSIDRTSAILTVLGPEPDDTGDPGDSGEPMDTGASDTGIGEDTAAFDTAEQVDTGLEEAPGPGASGEDTGAEAGDESKWCGCASAPGRGGLLFLAGLGAVRFRRRA